MVPEMTLDLKCDVTDCLLRYGFSIKSALLKVRGFTGTEISACITEPSSAEALVARQLGVSQK